MKELLITSAIHVFKPACRELSYVSFFDYLACQLSQCYYTLLDRNEFIPLIKQSLCRKLLCLMLLVVGLTSATLEAQRTTKMARYELALSFGAGSSFPKLEPTFGPWKPGAYVAGQLDVEVLYRFHPRWYGIGGVGWSTYLLGHVGPSDKYGLDFASSHIQVGLGRLSAKKKGGKRPWWWIYSAKLGAQIGFSDTLRESYVDYRVDIRSESLFYTYTRLELGIQWQWRKRWQRGKPKPVSSYGIFYRYNFTDLGIATITGPDYTVDLLPRGNVFGAYFRVQLPAGREQFKPKPPPPPPRTIFHPRAESIGT